MGKTQKESERTPTAESYRELFEHSADAILIIEGDKFVECNDAAVRMLRYKTREEVFSTHPSELSPPTQPDGRDSFQKANEMISLAFKHGNHRFEWNHKRADGEIFPVEVLLTAVQEGKRRVLNCVWRDITERKQLEQQLHHSQKLESVGRLAGGIAHDFNNLLVAIIGQSDLLSLQLKSNPRALERVAAISHAGARAAELVKQLLAFGRKQTHRPIVFDLQRLVKDLASLLEPLVGESTKLVTNFSDEEILIEADPAEIEQIVLNLATNARDAMGKTGVLEIGIKRINARKDDIGRGLSLESGEYALLKVSDNGCGMTPEVLKNAFDPFFTTKDVGKGTGLGLSTAYGIASQCGGGAAITSSPGNGAIVKVYLPISSSEIERSIITDETSTSPGGTEYVLVVDDENAVANLVEATLEEFGYNVLRANDGIEALEILTRKNLQIDLLLSDVIMPRMNGPELVTEMRHRGHNPAVLFMSGYPDDALTQMGESIEKIGLLQKPFSINDLVQLVRHTLDQQTDN